MHPPSFVLPGRPDQAAEFGARILNPTEFSIPHPDTSLINSVSAGRGLHPGIPDEQTAGSRLACAVPGMGPVRLEQAGNQEKCHDQS